MRTSLFQAANFGTFPGISATPTRLEAGLSETAFVAKPSMASHLFYQPVSQSLRHALFAATGSEKSPKIQDVPLPVIIEKNRRDREKEQERESGIPLYAPTPEPPPGYEERRKPAADDEPKRGVIIIGDEKDPNLVDFTI